MRIVSGIYGGRTVATPKTSATRPITHKMRGALFDILGDLSGLTVLDAYAGSGAVGIEALSRGAAQVDGIEASQRVAKIITDNLVALKITWGYSLHVMTVESWLAKYPGAVFDVIIADPPYEKLTADVLDGLASRLTDDGILAVSHTSKIAPPELYGVGLVSSRQYGDSTLSLYRATKP